MAKHTLTLKARIKQRIMKPMEIIIAALILLSVLSFAIETLPNKGYLLTNILAWADSIFLVVFSAEYLLRIWLADKKNRLSFQLLRRRRFNLYLAVLFRHANGAGKSASSAFVPFAAYL